MIFALMRGAFSAVICFSSAAGTRMSQSSSSAAGRGRQVGGAGEAEDRPGLLAVLEHLVLEVEARRVRDRALALGDGRPASRRPRGRNFAAW